MLQGGRLYGPVLIEKTDNFLDGLSEVGSGYRLKLKAERTLMRQGLEFQDMGVYLVGILGLCGIIGQAPMIERLIA